MNQKNKISSVVYISIFLILVVLLGIISFSKLVDFYVNDEVDYNEWSADLGSRLETDIATSFYQKFNFININGMARNILNQHEMNDVVKLNNGYLLSPISYVSDEDLKYNADAVIKLKKYLDERGIPFIYVITPYTSSKYDPQLPTGISDFGNNDLDRFSAILKVGGVEPLDLREEMHNDGIDQYELMYKTDHHWTTRCGFYAYSKINRQLIDLLGCSVDPQVMDFKNYTVKTYKNWHLGYNGQRTGAYFTGIDDFDLILPNFETSLMRDGNEGSYEELLINTEPLNDKDPTSKYTYDHVLNSFGNIHNNYSYNDKRLLLISDSYSRAVNPFLAISYKEIMTIGSGLTSHFLSEEYPPDAVIMFLYASDAVGNGEYSRSYYNFDLE